MPDEILDAAPADSSPADASTAPSAGTQNTAPPPEAQVPFHQHPRWQELMQERAGLRQTVSQLQQQLQQVAQRQQYPDAAPSKEYQDAAEALLKIMQAHPQLRQMLATAQATPHLARGYQTLQQQAQQATQMQQQAIVSSGRQAIADLAGKAGLPTDPRSLSRVEELVRAEIEQIDGGRQRFLGGDRTVVTEAFQAVAKDFLGQLRQQGNAALAQTKNATRRLPPAPRGGLAGPAAPKPLVEGKEREFEAGLHKSAMDRLTALLQG